MNLTCVAADVNLFEGWAMLLEARIPGGASWREVGQNYSFYQGLPDAW